MLTLSRKFLASCGRAGLLPLLLGVLVLQGCGQGSSSATPAPAAAGASVPGAPSAITVVAGNGSALVSWTAPADGGSAITGYTVTASPGGASVTVAGTVTSATVSGLSNGTAYTFVVVAINAVGKGTPSAASAPATPVAVPLAPASATAVPGNASAQVSWPTPASSDGSAITGYTVTAFLVSGSTTTTTGLTATAAAGSNSLAFSGLTNGNSYVFSVVASNAIGNSLSSPLSNAVTPFTVPDAPSGVVASAGNGSATVSWVAPAANGSPITSYTITAPSTGATITAAASATTATFTGLGNGTSYSFTVTASNAAGPGPASAPSLPVTPATVPDAPTGVTASAGNTTAFVTWNAPANGGSAITGYTVTPSGLAPVVLNGAATSVNITGLTDGTSYTFTVAATNALGSGPNSLASASVTPSPTAITVSISPRQAGITLSQTMQFTATVAGNANTAVTWAVDGTPGGNSTTLGTISGTGLYTPPTAGTLGGAHVITATSQVDPTRLASATLGVTDLAGVFTYHNDIQRTGQNLQEYALNPVNVASSFGRLFTCTLDGAVYAQPLYVANLNLGASGVHNVVFVVTMNDSVYAIDADGAVDPVSGGCLTYWFQNYLTAGATVAVPVTDITNAGDVPGTFGIMGTPVIGNGNIYFVDRIKTLSGPAYTEQLHALSIATGSEIMNSPVTIAASVTGTGQGGTSVTFDPRMQAQRPALLLLNNTVYIAFGSAGDVDPYFGWILAYDANALSQTAKFNSDPSTDPTGPGRGAFWLSGSGPASDGTSIFVATANGVFNNTGSVVPPMPRLNDMGDSLLKLSSSLAVEDFFTPSDQLTDYTKDLDFGSGGLIVLPDSMGSTGHPHLVIATGKPGKFYMDDRDSMARYDRGASNSDANVQTLVVNTSGIWSTPAVWGNNLYVGSFSAPLRAYTVNNAVISTVYTQTGDTISQSGGTPSISAMGTVNTAAANPIIWILDNGANGASFSSGTYGPAVLKAFDATNLGNRLYSSANSSADTCGYAVKFTVPTIANGKVYVADGGPTKGSSGQLTVYGLKP